MQVSAAAFFFAAIMLGVGSLMIMQWRVRTSVSWIFKLRMDFRDALEVIGLDKQMHPKSHLRQIAGYGSLSLGITAGVLFLVASLNR